MTETGEPALAPHEARVGWFLLAGVATTAAVLTRTEGWLLFVPLASWTALAATRRPTDRKALLGGAAASLATLPAILIAVNLTLLHDHPTWEWGRLNVLKSMAEWTWSAVAGPAAPLAEGATAPLVEGVAAPPTGGAAPAVAATVDPAVPPAEPATPLLDPTVPPADGTAGLGKDDQEVPPPLSLIYAEGILGAYKPALLIICGLGLVTYWRRLTRADAWPLWIIASAVMVSVLQRLLQFGEINGRYFLFPALLATPIAGLVLNGAARWAAASLRTEEASPEDPSRMDRWWRPALVGGAMALLAGLHIADGLQASHPRRGAERRAAAGLHERLDRMLAEGVADGAQGADGAAVVPRVWGVGAASHLAKEVAKASGGEVRTSFDGFTIEEAVAARPDLIVLPRRSGRAFDYEFTASAWTAAGFRALIPPDDADERAVWEKLVALVPPDVPPVDPAPVDPAPVDPALVDPAPVGRSPDPALDGRPDARRTRNLRGPNVADAPPARPHH